MKTLQFPTHRQFSAFLLGSALLFLLPSASPAAVFAKYELKNVQIVSYAFAASADGSAALEVTMSFEKIEWSYRDLEQNTTKVTVDPRKGTVELVEEPGGPKEE